MSQVGYSNEKEKESLMTGLNEPRLPTGQEVSCRALDGFFLALEQKGLSPDAFIADVDYPL